MAPGAPDAAGSVLLAHWRATHFASFAGAAVEVRLPVSQTLLDDVLAREVLPRVPALRRLEARILDDNRIDLSVAAGMAWLPTLTVPLVVEPEIAPGPRVRLQIVGGGLGPQLAPFAPKLGDGRLKGVRIHDRSIEVDLAGLLRPPDDRSLERWFDSGAIGTQHGVLWLTLRLALSVAPPSGR